MREHVVDIAGLRTTIVAGRAELADVVLLHGYSMDTSVLVPFAHALRLPARMLLPQAPCGAQTGGHTWWPVDAESRSKSLAVGPRDLADTHPPGRSAARLRLREFLQEVQSATPARPLILCGFSQGGMLACDSVLMDGQPAAALVLMSSCRIAADEWMMHRERLRGLPVYISHGRQDENIDFDAGLALRDFFMESGATVTWAEFEGGHAIPLVVWRTLKRAVESVTLRGRNTL